MRLAFSLVLIGALGCNNKPVEGKDGPVTTDTDTSEPNILPIDTSVFDPPDSGAGGINDLVPDNWVYLVQQGTWNVSYGTVSGQLRIQEYVDTLDTANPAYECNVRYSLTGTEVAASGCAGCTVIMDIEHVVTAGDPGACHDPDAPPDGAIWQMGFDPGTNKILFNYYGTGVWLPWYDATQAGSTITFDWSATLAIEVMDSGTM